MNTESRTNNRDIPERLPIPLETDVAVDHLLLCLIDDFHQYHRGITLTTNAETAMTPKLTLSSTPERLD